MVELPRNHIGGGVLSTDRLNRVNAAGCSLWLHCRPGPVCKFGTVSVKFMLFLLQEFGLSPLSMPGCIQQNKNASEQWDLKVTGAQHI